MVIDNRLIEADNPNCDTVLLLNTDGVTQALIIEIKEDSGNKYYSADTYKDNILECQWYYNDGSDLLETVKALREKGIDARILDIAKIGDSVIIQDDVTESYRQLKLI